MNELWSLLLSDMFNALESKSTITDSNVVFDPLLTRILIILR